MAGQQRELDGEAGGGQGLGQRPHRLGVAGEAVEHEDAVGPPAEDHGSAPGMIGAVTTGMLPADQGSDSGTLDAGRGGPVGAG